MNELEEYQNLIKKFPRQGTDALANENCDWSDHMSHSTNCYWCFDGEEVQECLYAINDWKITGCIDTLWNALSERCYETSDSVETADSYYSQYLARCYNMYFSFNCQDCHDCFGCVNLSHKEYCIFNIQHTEEEYQQKLPELKKMTPEEAIAKAKENEKKFPKIQSNFSDNENSEFVDYVYKSTNAYYCFDSNGLNDCCYVANSNDCTDSFDCTQTNRMEHSAECVDSRECFNCYEAQDSTRCVDSLFIKDCVDSNNLFMCTNLQNAKYCILNVQYTKEEYTERVAELKNKLELHYK